MKAKTSHSRTRGVEPIDAALLQEFVDVATQLSPEWLTCDGECSTAQVQRRARRLHAQWHALERKAGRAVTEDEVWAWKDARWARGGAQ